MACVSRGARGLACALFLLSACGRDPFVDEVECDEMSPGDLVVTEIHANPDGGDGKGEYIELFNASDAMLALDGLVLLASKDDGTSPKRHRFAGASLEAGDYLVVGNAEPDSMPAHLDYTYGGNLGSLRNSDALISLRCGGVVIDDARYARTSDGYALQLDGRLQPDHLANDEAAHWCAATESLGEAFPGNFGTPGAANGACELARIEGTCLEGGSGRAIVVPEHGDLRISEWMANPAGADTGFEWVELRFEADADLNALQLGPAPDALKAVVEQEDCFPVGAGARVVFGASPAAAPRVDAELRFSLANSGERGILAGVDGVVLDRVDYESTTSGVAWQVDSKGDVCLASAGNEYVADNFGTPGQVNPACAPKLGPGMCFDGGAPRDIVSPRPGEARITEWMANPAAVGNRDGEWVEVLFDAPVDLNELTLSDLTARATTVESEACLSVAQGAHVVFARNLDRAENGGLDDVDAKLSLSLNNSDETITLSIDDRVLDSIMYEDSTPGAATQVDSLGNVCDATSPYGDGDSGTPGAANPRCP